MLERVTGIEPAWPAWKDSTPRGGEDGVGGEVVEEDQDRVGRSARICRLDEDEGAVGGAEADTCAVAHAVTSPARKSSPYRTGAVISRRRYASLSGRIDGRRVARAWSWRHALWLGPCSRTRSLLPTATQPLDGRCRPHTPFV